jgi:contractile injection system tube protein
MSATDTGLAKATIHVVDKKSGLSGNPPIACMFNPKEYTFTKNNSWAVGKIKGKNVPKLEFGSGNPATLTMDLHFDTWDTGGAGGDVLDVRTYTDQIWELMLVDPKLSDQTKYKLGRPPIVHFQWGNAWSFDAVITSLSAHFTLFDRKGTPVRALLNVTFQQAVDAKLFPKQNPTSGGREGGTLWTVKDGDTLAWIAWNVYGDPNAWRRIADANRLTDVRRLRPGMVLEAPSG